MGFFVVVLLSNPDLTLEKQVCLLIRMCVVKQPILHVSLILTLGRGMNTGLFGEMVQS